VRRLINAATNPRDRAILKLFYATGCRLGELVNIRLEHVDFARRTILVRGKIGDRRVFFGLTAKRKLREHLRGRKAGHLSTDKVGPGTNLLLSDKFGKSFPSLLGVSFTLIRGVIWIAMRWLPGF
jgi:integrase/recombinase XerC